MPTNFPSWGHGREGLESHFREKLQIPYFWSRVRTHDTPTTPLNKGENGESCFRRQRPISVGWSSSPFHLQETSYRRRPLQPWNYEIMQNMFHARFKFNGRGGNAEEQGRDATTTLWEVTPICRHHMICRQVGVNRGDGRNLSSGCEGGNNNHLI